MIPKSLNLIEEFWFYGHLLKHSHFQNSLDFCDRWAKDYVGNGLSLLCFGEAHWSVSTKETRFNGIPQGIIMKGYSRHNSSLIGRKNRAKFENDRISRNGHGIKTTQPNLMILVSFCSAEDVWSNDVNRYNTFSSQGTENPPFRFFWDTRYICQLGHINWQFYRKCVANLTTLPSCVFAIKTLCTGTAADHKIWIWITQIA